MIRSPDTENNSGQARNGAPPMRVPGTHAPCKMNSNDPRFLSKSIGEAGETPLTHFDHFVDEI